MNSNTVEEQRRRIDLINQIVKRAEELDLLYGDRGVLFMDLGFVDDEIGLRLEDFLAAEDQGFAHDINGIQKNFNRKTLKMDNLFLPRFAISK